MNIRLLALILAVAAASLPSVALSAPSAAARRLKAGAATSNITPPLGLGIVGGWSARPATHIHDEFHVRCLALDDGTTRLAFAPAHECARREPLRVRQPT